MHSSTHVALMRSYIHSFISPLRIRAGLHFDPLFSSSWYIRQMQNVTLPLNSPNFQYATLWIGGYMECFPVSLKQVRKGVRFSWIVLHVRIQHILNGRQRKMEWKDHAAYGTKREEPLWRRAMWTKSRRTPMNEKAHSLTRTARPIVSIVPERPLILNFNVEILAVERGKCVQVAVHAFVWQSCIYNIHGRSRRLLVADKSTLIHAIDVDNEWVARAARLANLSDAQTQIPYENRRRNSN